MEYCMQALQIQESVLGKIILIMPGRYVASLCVIQV